MSENCRCGHPKHLGICMGGGPHYNTGGFAVPAPRDLPMPARYRAMFGGKNHGCYCLEGYTDEYIAARATQ